MKTKIIFKIGLALLIFGTVSFSIVNDKKKGSSSRIETFTFSTNGINTKGKIFLPDSYSTNKLLPVIYLVDFTEQHFKLATDEFERVIDGVQQLEDFDALVVSLESIPELDAVPDNYQKQYDIFKNMAIYVNENYTNNYNGTLIGKGSEAGLVLMSLFVENLKTSIFENYIVTDLSPKYVSAIIKEIEEDSIPKNKFNKKLHYSFSTSNNREKCLKLIHMIKENNYQGLQVESIEYSESNFENTYPISFAAGIKYVFKK